MEPGGFLNATLADIHHLGHHNLAFLLLREVHRHIGLDLAVISFLLFLLLFFIFIEAGVDIHQSINVRIAIGKRNLVMTFLVTFLILILFNDLKLLAGGL